MARRAAKPLRAFESPILTARVLLPTNSSCARSRMLFMTKIAQDSKPIGTAHKILKAILWAGGFDPTVGGYIGALKLTKQVVVVAPTPTPTPTPTQTKLPTPTPTPTPVVIAPSPTPTPLVTVTTVKKVTIACVKGKVTKKVTAIKPTCPAGYKKK